MSNPIKHHYVPQCYLKRFSLDRKKIMYYDKQSGICSTEEIGKICQIENFYLLSQSEPYYIETTFFANDNEDKLGRILTYFDTVDYSSANIGYDINQRKNLSKQLVLQYMRTPSYRSIKSRNELNAYYEQIKFLLKLAFDFNVEEIEFRPNNKAEFHKTLLLEDNEDIISEIAEADWELLHTSCGEFYTSDNPVTIKRRNDMPVSYCDAIQYFSEIYYPLNPKFMLHIMAHPMSSTKKINIRPCEDKELLNINTLIAEKAIQYVIYTHQLKLR